MTVYLISSAMLGIDESFHVVAVRSSQALAEAFVESQGKVVDWRSTDGVRTFAEVEVKGRRRDPVYSYGFSIRAMKVDE